MQTIEREYTVKKLNEGIENKTIVFDHPMQRKPGQWDLEQQSLLIHSILAVLRYHRHTPCNSLKGIMIHFPFWMVNRDLQR